MDHTVYFYSYCDQNLARNQIQELRAHSAEVEAHLRNVGLITSRPLSPSDMYLIEDPHRVGSSYDKNSFDYEQGDSSNEKYAADLRQMHRAIESILARNERTEVSVYMNPKELFKHKSEEVKALHDRTIQLLTRPDNRGCVLIPAYTYVPKETSHDGKEHGVNIKDTITLVEELQRRGTNFKLILGVHSYDFISGDKVKRNAKKFKENLELLKAKGCDGRFCYFGLQTKDGLYDINQELLQEVIRIFGKL